MGPKSSLLTGPVLCDYLTLDHPDRGPEPDRRHLRRKPEQGPRKSTSDTVVPLLDRTPQDPLQINPDLVVLPDVFVPGSPRPLSTGRSPDIERTPTLNTGRTRPSWSPRFPWDLDVGTGGFHKDPEGAEDTTPTVPRPTDDQSPIVLLSHSAEVGRDWDDSLQTRGRPSTEHPCLPVRWVRDG